MRQIFLVAGSYKFLLQFYILKVVLFVSGFNMFLFIENDIDGAVLAILPEDFVEFSHLVPQSGLRIKLKQLLRN